MFILCLLFITSPKSNGRPSRAKIFFVLGILVGSVLCTTRGGNEKAAVDVPVALALHHQLCLSLETAVTRTCLQAFIHCTWLRAAQSWFSLFTIKWRLYSQVARLPGGAGPSNSERAVHAGPARLPSGMTRPRRAVRAASPSQKGLLV